MSIQSSGNLPLGQTVIYGLPALPLALPTLILFISLPTLYFERFGLSLAMVGTLLMLARLGDMALDPFIGRWVDRLHAAQQKRLIALGGAICIPGMYLSVYPLEGLTALSLLAGLSFLYFGWTLIQIPHQALLARIVPDSYQRTRLASWREGFGIIGLLLSAAIPAALVFAGLDSLNALRALLLVAILFGVISLALLVFKLKWPENTVHAGSTKSAWLDFKANKTARKLLSAWFTNGLANGIPAVLFPLYITHVLALPESSRSYLILIYFICAILALPLWLKLSRHAHKNRLWRIAMLIAIASFIPAAFLGAGDTLPFVIICVLTGVTLGADLALPPAMQADVSDQHRELTGKDQTAFLFALWNLSTKLALALSAILAFGLVEFSGFNPEKGSLGQLALIYALLPAVLKIVAVIQLKRIIF